MINEKLRLYNGNIQRIVVKMAEMNVSEGCFRRKMTKLKGIKTCVTLLKMQILYDKISNRNY